VNWGQMASSGSDFGAALVGAAAARHAAGMADKATQRALREARLNEKTRHAEWLAEQQSREARFNAWQNARNKFLSEKLGFALPYGGSGGGGTVVIAPAGSSSTRGNTAPTSAPTSPAQTAELSPGSGVTLAELGGVSPFEWNDWNTRMSGGRNA